jgi:hypothetical protein
MDADPAKVGPSFHEEPPGHPQPLRAGPPHARGLMAIPEVVGTAVDLRKPVSRRFWSSSKERRPRPSPREPRGVPVVAEVTGAFVAMQLSGKGPGSGAGRSIDPTTPVCSSCAHRRLHRQTSASARPGRSAPGRPGAPCMP